MKWYNKQKVTTTIFELWRDKDVKDISGTGHVLDGVVFPDGTTVVRWRKKKKQSVGIFSTFGQFCNVHVTGGNHRDGMSRVVWVQGFDGINFANKYLQEVAGQLAKKRDKAREPKEKEIWALASSWVGMKSSHLHKIAHGEEDVQ